MKVCKTFSIDYELIEFLNKEKNMSDIINSYLTNYYGLKKKEKDEDA